MHHSPEADWRVGFLAIAVYCVALVAFYQLLLVTP